jgi:hypothetical protein
MKKVEVSVSLFLLLTSLIVNIMYGLSMINYSFLSSVEQEKIIAECCSRTLNSRRRENQSNMKYIYVNMKIEKKTCLVWERIEN